MQKPISGNITARSIRAGLLPAGFQAKVRKQVEFQGGGKNPHKVAKVTHWVEKGKSCIVQRHERGTMLARQRGVAARISEAACSKQQVLVSRGEAKDGGEQIPGTNLVAGTTVTRLTRRTTARWEYEELLRHSPRCTRYGHDLEPQDVRPLSGVQAEGTTTTGTEWVDVEQRQFYTSTYIMVPKGESRAQCMVGAMLDSRARITFAGVVFLSRLQQHFYDKEAVQRFWYGPFSTALDGCVLLCLRYLPVCSDPQGHGIFAVASRS